MAIQVLPPQEEWDWKYDSGKSITDWTDLPEASSAVCDLIKRRCNPEKGFHGRCVNACSLVLNCVCAKGSVREMIEVNEHKQ